MSPVEGVSSYISAEWLQATSTGFVALAFALWMWLGEASLWRRHLWRARSATILAVAHTLEGRVEPLWRGWRVVAPQVTVEWRDGVFGARTRLRVGGVTRVSEASLLDEHVLVALARFR